MRATYEGREFHVQFTGEWHNPPLPGTIDPERIQHTTTCVVREARGANAVGENLPVAIASAHCSVVDRFNELTGCKKAMRRAVAQIVCAEPRHRGVSPLLLEAATTIMHAAFKRQLMPVLAADYARRQAAKPRPRPGVRALNRALDHLTANAAFAIVAMQFGPGVAIEQWLAGQVAARDSAEESRARARRQKVVR